MMLCRKFKVFCLLWLLAALFLNPGLSPAASRAQQTEDFRNDLLTSGIAVICVKRILNRDYPDAEKMGRAITARYRSLGQETITDMAATLIATGLVFEKEFNLDLCADALPLSIAEAERDGLNTGLFKEALSRLPEKLK